MPRLLRILSGLPFWTYIPLAVGLYLFYQSLQGAGWYLVLAAALGWAVLALAVCRQTGHMQALTTAAPIAHLLDWLTAGMQSAPAANSHIATPPPAVNDLRQQLAERVTAGKLRAFLDNIIVGQERLTAEVAQAIEVFLHKEKPSKPLSIILAGAAASGRTTFATELAKSKVFEGRSALVRIDCANDADADLAKVSEMIKDITVPVILLDNFDRIGSHRHYSAFAAALTRILDEGVIAGGAAFRKAIVIMTVSVDPSIITALLDFQKDKSSLMLRKALAAADKLSKDILTRAEIVGVMKPLSPSEQIEAAWNAFCRQTKEESSITILTDRLDASGGLVAFFAEVLAKWQQAGEGGIYEAIRFVSNAAQGALRAAKQSGYTTVRPRWDRRARELCFDPVAS
jgi:hypothetical protein